MAHEVEREAGPDWPRHRLESWKEIAAYLGRDVRTAQRWERLGGLPVHRLRTRRLVRRERERVLSPTYTRKQLRLRGKRWTSTRDWPRRTRVLPRRTSRSGGGQKPRRRIDAR